MLTERQACAAMLRFLEADRVRGGKASDDIAVARRPARRAFRRSEFNLDEMLAKGGSSSRSVLKERPRAVCFPPHDEP